MSRQSRDIYNSYVNRGHVGAGPVSEANLHAYKRYANEGDHDGYTTKLEAWQAYDRYMNKKYMW